MATPMVALRPGSVFDLYAGAIHKRIGPRTLPMYAFNGSIPGPTLVAAQDSEVVVHFTNDLTCETLVHWHGLRLSNLFDRLLPGDHERAHPHVPPGSSFSYRLRFPDPGFYWYHHHAREDSSPEHGLYGGIIVVPTQPEYWPRAHRDLTLLFDEVLLPNASEQDGAPPAGRDPSTEDERLMLLNGDTGCALHARPGEVLRLYLANVANSRVLRLGLTGAQLKYIGGDVGQVEQEKLVDEVVICPWQRAIVDALFERPGRYHLQHRSADGVRFLGCVDVQGPSPEPALAPTFSFLRTSDALRREREALRDHWKRSPDKTLRLTEAPGEPGPFLSPHPTDTLALGESAGSTSPSRGHPWQVLEIGTGKVNNQIEWSFAAGERVKIRLIHEPAAGSLVWRPIHFHGQRFLVLARNDVRNDNLAWQDSLCLAAGDTVDLLLEAANPGAWAVHCHRPEHGEQEMLFLLRVR